MVARTLTASQVAALRIPTADEMHTLAAAIPQLQRGTWQAHDVRPGTFLELGPGVIRVFRSSAHLDDKAKIRANETAAAAGYSRLRRMRSVYRQPMALTTDEDLGIFDRPHKAGMRTSRGRITAWSRRSRARMNVDLNRIDFTPLFEDHLEPAMVTLTMPGKDDDGRDTWTDYAPTPAAFKTIVNRFCAAYRKAWGAPIRGAWKMEFQLRGAPHLHILMTPPAGLAAGQYPFEFAAWLSHAWARAVGSTGSVRLRHEGAGTGVDYVGEAYRDPRRIALYFGKHGFFQGKDYQNELPKVWRDAIAQGERGARFWGVWGLKKASAVLQLDDVASTASEHIAEACGVSSDCLTYQCIIGKSAFEQESEAAWATDASVLRAWQRYTDEVGSRSADDVKVQRHLRKLSRSLAMRGQQLERNKHGQPVLPRGSTTIRRVSFDAVNRDTGEVRRVRRYRIGYYQGGSGFVLVHDGRRTARDIQRLLDTRAAWALTA